MEQGSQFTGGLGGQIGAGRGETVHPGSLSERKWLNSDLQPMPFLQRPIKAALNSSIDIFGILHLKLKHL